MTSRARRRGSDAPGRWQGRVVCVVLHPTDGTIALVRHDGWVLPWVDCSEWFREVDELRQRLRAAFGVDAIVLRPLPPREAGDADAGDTAPPHLAFLMELVAGDGSVNGSLRWVAPEWVARHVVDPPEVRAWVEGSIEEADADEAPWSTVGWYATTKREIAEQLRALDDGRLLEMTQVRISPRGCLLRCETTGGLRYFKALPASASLEVRAAVRLSALFPESTPRVLAFDLDRRWILMRESAGQPLIELDGLETWCRALRAYARMQIDSAAYVDALVADGLEERRPERWGRSSNGELSAVAALHQTFSGEAIADLDGLRRRLGEQAAALHEIDLPLTLHHADLNPANVMIDDDRCAFLDWDAASIAHPFCSVVVCLEYFKHLRPELRECAPMLLDAYLSEWCGPHTLEELWRAFALVKPFAVLEYAAPISRALLRCPGRYPPVSPDVERFLADGLRGVLHS